MAPSWQARLLNVVVKALARRRNWGDETQRVARARRIWGRPRLAFLEAKGVVVEPFVGHGLRGEWLRPSESAEKVVLYIHGGAYLSCSPATHRPLTSALAEALDRPIFAVDYRLAPEHRFPAAFDDVVAAYRFLLDSGYDGESIALAGDSAGGGLALGLLAWIREHDWPRPSAAVLLSPWTDLTVSGSSVAKNDHRCALFHPQNLRDFAKTYLGEADPHDPRASPLLAELGDLPPLLILVGSTELLLDDAVRVHEKILAAAGESRLEIFEDIFHAWPLVTFLPDARRAIALAAGFIARVTQPNGRLRSDRT